MYRSLKYFNNYVSMLLCYSFQNIMRMVQIARSPLHKARKPCHRNMCLFTNDFWAEARSDE